MPKEPVAYLKHILKECEFILSAVTPNATKNDLLEDETLKRAVVRSLEVVGEASKKITADVKLKWNTIQWKSMAGMRDRLIHDYMGTDYSIVWNVVRNDIPELSKQVAEVIRNEEEKNKL